MRDRLFRLFRAVLASTLFVWFLFPVSSHCEPRVRVGIATILTGDLSVVGDNIQKSVEAYRRLNPSMPLEILFEDAKLSSVDGRSAYQALIHRHHIQIAIAACTSNGTVAAKGLFDSSRVPVISVSTGGRSIDTAGPYVFRLGNSDSLNGTEQAEVLLAQGFRRAALLTEQTEYTEDVSSSFRKTYVERGAHLTYDESFAPGTTDYRTMLTRIRNAKPDVLVIPSQTGASLGLILKQWQSLSPDWRPQIFTTFVAGTNLEAHRIAGEQIVGVHYMDPSYSTENPRREQLFAKYRELFSAEPTIPFHTAGVADTLDLISEYLKTHRDFDEVGFRTFLLGIKDYKGMLGELSFDAEGNTAVGFRLARIERNAAGLP